MFSSLRNSFSWSGRGGIRTHGPIARSPDFESGTFNHSATLPSDRVEENSGKMENGKEAIETRKIDNGCGQLNGDRQFITKHPFRSRRQITTGGDRPIQNLWVINSCAGSLTGKRSATHRRASGPRETQRATAVSRACSCSVEIVLERS